jgi:hypothetical protein
MCCQNFSQGRFMLWLNVFSLLLVASCSTNHCINSERSCLCLGTKSCGMYKLFTVFVYLWIANLFCFQFAAINIGKLECIRPRLQRVRGKCWIRRTRKRIRYREYYYQLPVNVRLLKCSTKRFLDIRILAASKVHFIHELKKPGSNEDERSISRSRKNMEIMKN